MKRLLLLRIAADPVARVCSGVNPIIIPADAVELAPARYLGGGQLVSLPDLNQLINGVADRVQVMVSGVTGSVLASFKAESPSLKGAAVHVGIAYQDDDWQITDVEWLSVLRCDAPTIGSQAAQTGCTRSITLSIGTDFTDRSRAPLAFFTAADQARRSPDDQIFDHVSGITTGTSRPFGPSDA